MTRQEYKTIEAFMTQQMKDSAHDRYHIYRVLNAALDIAKHTDKVDIDVLLAACLLHDVGRERQFANLELCHAQIGGKMAFEFLLSQNWCVQKASHVRECISSHRYRRDNRPQSMEAKILFDADKLDASGAIGIARTLIYEGQVSEPLYILNQDGSILVDGGGAEISSFFQEYHYKLNKLYTAFYTGRAREIAMRRQKTAMDYYNGLYDEVVQNHLSGQKLLDEALTEVSTWT